MSRIYIAWMFGRMTPLSYLDFFCCDRCCAVFCNSSSVLCLFLSSNLCQKEKITQRDSPLLIHALFFLAWRNFWKLVYSRILTLSLSVRADPGLIPALRVSVLTQQREENWRAAELKNLLPGFSESHHRGTRSLKRDGLKPEFPDQHGKWSSELRSR